MKIFLLLILIVAVHVKLNKFQWIKMKKQSIGLPSSIKLFRLNTTESVFGTKLNGAYARIDFKDKNLQFKVVSTNNWGFKTPIQWAQDDQNIVYTSINGGFFNWLKPQSTSFICSEGKVLHRNSINIMHQQNIYPTVGAIGQLKNGSFGIQYIYSFGEQNETYTYQKPNPYPGPEPRPIHGKRWPVKQGVGAGPILIKNGKLIKGNPEYFYLQKMSFPRHPRSGVCYDQLGRLYLIVIDGRGGDSDGLNMEQFAILLQDLGCIDALNLDGGGSSLLYANNQLLTYPSQPVPRSVMSAILIRDKHKKKRPNLSINQDIFDEESQETQSH